MTTKPYTRPSVPVEKVTDTQRGEVREEDDDDSAEVVDVDSIKPGTNFLHGGDPAELLDTVARTAAEKNSSEFMLKRLLRWIFSKVFYDFSNSQPTPTVKFNVYMFLSAWLLTGWLAIWMTFEDAELLGRGGGGNGDDAPVTVTHLPLPEHPILIKIVQAKHWIYLASLLMTSVMTLADRRGHLLGFPFLRNHFNLILYLSRFAGLLVAFNMGYAIAYSTDHFMWEAAAVWAFAILAKWASLRRILYSYTWLNILWLNLSSLAVVCLYSFKQK